MLERIQPVYSLEKCNLVGGDNTAANTGWRNGAFRAIEVKLDKPMQRNTCIIHLFELPLGKLFEFHDGPTTGPESWSGPIGKKIVGKVEVEPLVDFDPIPNPNFPAIATDVVNNLTPDQKYFVQICQGVMSGVISQDLRDSLPGVATAVRFLTTASRIIRVYVSTESPSIQLIRMVNYIVKCYAPAWLRAKHLPKIANGPRHFLNLAR